MAKLTGSVGKGGKNNAEDVKQVQLMLNKHQSAAGFSKLTVSGEADSSTLKAIGLFQKAIGMPKPDGRVDPGGKTFKALEEKEIPKQEAPAGGGKGNGRVVGNLGGVQSDIVDFVTAVAAFYGREIKISSGKRDAKEQGAAMFKYWDINLKRGKLYVYLQSNAKLLAELEKLYVTAAEDKTKTAKEAAEAKASFIKLCSEHAAKLSTHVAGKAIDISPKSCMSKNMRDAMKTGLKELEEKSCYHYDTKGSVPAPSDSLKSKWKAA